MTRAPKRDNALGCRKEIVKISGWLKSAVTSYIYISRTKTTWWAKFRMTTRSSVPVAFTCTSYMRTWEPHASCATLTSHSKWVLRNSCLSVLGTTLREISLLETRVAGTVHQPCIRLKGLLRKEALSFKGEIIRGQGISFWPPQDALLTAGEKH